MLVRSNRVGGGRHCRTERGGDPLSPAWLVEEDVDTWLSGTACPPLALPRTRPALPAPIRTSPCLDHARQLRQPLL